jgi:hypothetical protein
MSDLTDLLKKIDPSKTIDLYQSRLDEAINSFDVPKPKFENYEQLKDYLGEYLWHLECILGDYGEKLRHNKKSLDYNKGFCTDIFYKHYGGYFQKTTLDMANTGVQGGLRQLLKEITDYVFDKRVESSIAAPVSDFVNRQMKHVKEYKKTVDEYAGLYGHLLPPKMLEDDNWRLYAEFYEVLTRHPYMIKQMREIGRI